VAGTKVGDVVAAVGRTVYFQDLTNGSPISWQWTATRGGTVQTSSDQNPGFAFSDTGSEDIALTTHTMAGNTAKTLAGLVDVRAGSALGASFAFDYSNMVKAQTPVSYWRLGEGAGTTMVDAMGHNNGTYSGAVAFGPGLLHSPDSNGALTLGAGAYDISVPDSASLHLSVFSLAFKISRIRSGTAEDLFAANGLILGISATNHLQLRFPGGVATSNVNMATGNYDIVATYTGGVVHLFVNGVDNTSVSGTLPVNYQLAGPLSIGAGGTATQFQGTIDELVLYPRVLASADVNALAAAATQSAMTATSATIVAFANESSGGPTSYSWDFGDGSGASVANPTHQYTTSGSYTVWLTISDGTNWTSVMAQNLVTVP
jgi:PKD repeat protein